MTYQMRHPPTLAEDHERLRALRSAIGARIDADIALLDALDSDPDLKPDGCAELACRAEIRGGARVRAA